MVDEKLFLIDLAQVVQLLNIRYLARMLHERAVYAIMTKYSIQYLILPYFHS